MSFYPQTYIQFLLLPVTDQNTPSPHLSINKNVFSLPILPQDLLHHPRSRPYQTAQYFPLSQPPFINEHSTDPIYPLNPVSNQPPPQNLSITVLLGFPSSHPRSHLISFDPLPPSPDPLSCSPLTPLPPLLSFRINKNGKACWNQHWT